MPASRAHTAEKRTNTGCWICRLRRLKCDEGAGSCIQCSRHGIVCEVYGKEKPPWKDGGPKEAEKLNSIKDAISRKRKRDRQCPPNDEPAAAPADIVVSTPSITDPPGTPLPRYWPPPWGDKSGSSDPLMATPSELYMLFAVDSPSTKSAAAALQLSPPSMDKISTSNSVEMTLYSSMREDQLLMHYLDFVFTLQFRHHKYAAHFSSRGWLFSLVKRIRPLRLSILSLSALHQYRLSQHGLFEGSINDSLKELQDHHAAALSELRQFIRDQTRDSLADNHISILACCIQLISFDLFQGGKGEWQMHLQAATLLIQKHFELIGPGSSSEHTFHKDIASNFCTGAIIWFDILSSVTTRQQPTLYSSHQRLLKDQPPLVNLERIMGCENSVMILIGEISVLQQWKSKSLITGQLNVWLLVDKAKLILKELEDEIERLNLRLQFGIISGSSELPGADENDEVYITTNIFACAAVVFLHAVVCGFYPSLPEIKCAVEQTILAMKRIKEFALGPLARTLVWPALITGCLAEEKQEDFFRRFFLAGSDNAHGFGNCHIAKEILETCWKNRNQSKNSGSQVGEVWDWSQAMQQLGYHVLLV